MSRTFFLGFVRNGLSALIFRIHLDVSNVFYTIPLFNNVQLKSFSLLF